MLVDTDERHALIRHCSVQERVNNTQQQCAATVTSRSQRQQPRKAGKPRASTSLSAVTKNIFVDEKHHVLLCVPYKSGASTHLNLLAQNSDAVLKH